MSCYYRSLQVFLIFVCCTIGSVVLYCLIKHSNDEYDRPYDGINILAANAMYLGATIVGAIMFLSELCLPIPLVRATLFPLVRHDRNCSSAGMFGIYFWGLVFAWISFGKNCYFYNCYTITSPLYLFTLIDVHMSLVALFLLIMYGLWKCEELTRPLQQLQPAPNNDNQDYKLMNPIVVDDSEPVASYLTFESIKNLKARQEDTMCSICHGDFNNKDPVEVLQSCSHYFHKSCIDEWKKKKADSSCPICRITIVTVH